MERGSAVLNRDQKLAIYMEGAVDNSSGKMGHGILRYSPNPITCVIDRHYAGRDMKEVGGSPLSCPIVAGIDEALALGSEVLVLGIAPPGGLIPDDWYPVIAHAVAKGMSIVNGLHDLLGPRYQALPTGQWIWDIRIEPPNLAPGVGAARHLSNRRALMIGTDMSIGKMTAGLEIVRIARERGVRAEFIATGQIGITITGSGVPLDAVRVDFASGAIEREVLNAKDADLVVVEGQGALIHPGSTANLPLLRGSCPTHLVLCHRAGQHALQRMPDIAIPPLADYIRMYEDLGEACGTFPRPRTRAVCLNTSAVSSDAEALRACETIENELGIPCVDPVRHSADRVVAALS